MALCLSVTGRNSVETAEQIKRVFARELSLTYPVLFCKRNSGTSETKSTSLWNFAAASGLSV